MISIVSPTMWKYPPYLDFIKYVVRMDVIKEVIIINNAPENTPDNDILNHEKIKMFSFGRNIFINPAWNFGIQASESDIVCILNDDIHFDLRLFYKVEEFYQPDMGALGLNGGIVEYNQTPVTNGMIHFEPFWRQNCHGFGELMFIRKSTWCDIPPGLDLGFGDNFIFDHYFFSGYQNYFITDLFHYHAGSTTVGQLNSDPKIMNDLYLREQALYETIIKPKLVDRTFYLTGSRI